MNIEELKITYSQGKDCCGELRQRNILDYSGPVKKDMIYFILKKPD